MLFRSNGSVRHYRHRTYPAALRHGHRWAQRKVAEARRALETSQKVGAQNLQSPLALLDFQQNMIIVVSELEKLRASRPKAPAIHAVENAMGGQVLEAACMPEVPVQDVLALRCVHTLFIGRGASPL